MHPENTQPYAPQPADSAWKRRLAGALHYTGALGAVRRLSRSLEVETRCGKRLRRVTGPRYAILCYHRVGTEGVPLFSTLPPEIFEAQIRFLRRHYRLVSLEQLCAELQDPSARGQAVAVTFDDGYVDTYHNAFPILKKYEVPAMVFVIVGSIESGQVAWYDKTFLALKVFPGTTLEIELDQIQRFALVSPVARMRAAMEINNWLRTVPDGRRREFCAAFERRFLLPQMALAGRMMNWDQVREMHRAGIAFGSHTLTHPAVSRLNVAGAEAELLVSRQILEQQLGSPAPDFAFPFGKPADCGPQAAAQLAGFGYRSAVTTSYGLNTPGANPYALRRISLEDAQSLPVFALNLSLAFCLMEDSEPGCAEPVAASDWPAVAESATSSPVRNRHA